MSILKVENIKKSFGNVEVLKDISFSLEKGEVLSIIGSSGSGKTTLLRCLNFLEFAENGKIIVDDELLVDFALHDKQNDESLRQKRLNFGLVFQSFNLFPQYSILKNLTLAVELLEGVKKKDKEKNKEKNTPYLNPKYVNYLEMPEKERKKVALIPDIYVIDYQGEKNEETSETFPSYYNLGSVNGKNYLSPMYHQGNLGLCWAFTSIEQAESYVTLKKNERNHSYKRW